MVRSRIASRLRTAGVVAAALFAAACKMESKPAPAPAPPPPPAAPNVVTFHAHDFAYTGPDTIAAGLTTITLVNDGPGAHHIQLVRVDSGKTAAEVRAALKDRNAFPGWTTLDGGPNVVGAGKSSSATMDLRAGWYVMLCLVDFPDHVPDYSKGMVSAFYAAPSTAPAVVQGPADVTITATEDAFAMPDTVHAGLRSFEFKNEGTQAHEAMIIKLKAGTTLKDLSKWLVSYKGTVPLSLHGGVSALEAGKSARFTADLEPGDYLVICAVADAETGKPEFQLGMQRAFKVI